jgi:hypothetical protein
MVWL